MPIAGSTLGLVFYFFFVQHLKLKYFNTFNSTCDFSTTNLTDLDVLHFEQGRRASVTSSGGGFWDEAPG